MDQKVEVGQVVGNGRLRYQITKIGFFDDCHTCWASQIRLDGSLSGEEVFGYLNADGIPLVWVPGWILEKPAPVPVAKPASLAQSPAIQQDHKVLEMQFFRASAHPDVCSKCAAPLPCSYHP